MPRAPVIEGDPGVNPRGILLSRPLIWGAAFLAPPPSRIMLEGETATGPVLVKVGSTAKPDQASFAVQAPFKGLLGKVRLNRAYYVLTIEAPHRRLSQTVYSWGARATITVRVDAGGITVQAQGMDLMEGP